MFQPFFNSILPYLLFRYDDGIASQSILCLRYCFNNVSYTIIFVSRDSICSFINIVNNYLFILFCAVLRQFLILGLKFLVFFY